jgi:alpha-beta hydrolase superfamily lysophospholipase
MFFLERGFRVIAHDRRGHGRSTQTVTGNEMNTYAADVAELVEKLDLKNAIHIGHSTWRRRRSCALCGSIWQRKGREGSTEQY